MALAGRHQGAAQLLDSGGGSLGRRQRGQCLIGLGPAPGALIEIVVQRRQGFGDGSQAGLAGGPLLDGGGMALLLATQVIVGLARPVPGAGRLAVLLGQFLCCLGMCLANPGQALALSHQGLVELVLAVALGQPGGGGGGGVGGGGETVPAPQRTVAANQTLAGCEVLAQFGTAGAVDDTDLGEPALQCRRRCDVITQGLAACRQR